MNGPARAGSTNIITGGPAAGLPYLPTTGSLALANPNVLDNPSNTNTRNFASLESRTVKLNNYNDVNYVFTYKFPSFELKYVGGYQGYDYDLNYSEPDTAVGSYQMPVLAPGVTPLTINPLVNLNYQQNDWWTSHEIDLQSTDDSRLQWIAGVLLLQRALHQPDPGERPGSAAAGPPGVLDHHLCSGRGEPEQHPVLPELRLLRPEPRRLRPALLQGHRRHQDLRRSALHDDRKAGTESNRDVAFNDQLIDGFAPYLGAGTPSLDATLSLTCPTGNPANCASGPLAKGVTSIGVVGANGIETRGLGDSSSAWTGGAGIEWTPNRDTFLYARYSRGYEDLSFNAGYVSSNPEVAPEFIDAYEIGYKQAIGRTFTIDTAAFYYDYSNLQLPVSIAVGGVTESTFVNAPKAKSEGVEIESEWAPVRNLLLTATWSYDYTALATGCSLTAAGAPAAGALCVVDTDDPNAVAQGAHPVAGQAPGVRFQSVKGDPLPNAPRNKIAFNANYTFNFEPGDLTLSASYVWRDVQDGTIFNRAYDNAPSWDDVDLRALWKAKDDRYEVIGFVKNVFNTLQYQAADEGEGLLGTNATSTTAAAGLVGVNVYNLAPPRTYGLEVRYKFF
ncbi:MAG: TonB-dependent receptor [Caulobacteraceae bacterium]